MNRDYPPRKDGRGFGSFLDRLELNRLELQQLGLELQEILAKQSRTIEGYNPPTADDIGKIVKFRPIFGREYLEKGWTHGRIEGYHPYTPVPALTIRRLYFNDVSGQLEVMNAVDGMVPDFAVEIITEQE